MSASTDSIAARRRAWTRIVPLVLIAAAFLVSPAPCPAQTVPNYTITTIAGNNTAGFSGDGAGATSAQLNVPVALALDSHNNLYIADQANNRIRKLSSGNISTVVGSGGSGYAGDAGAATSAQINNPTGLVFDSKGNLYFSDTRNNVVRVVAPSGTIDHFAGDNALGAGFGGDTGGAIYADLSGPEGLAVDSAGNVYIADSGNNRIRKVDTSSIITTFAGSGTVGFAGNGGPQLQAHMNFPRDLAMSADGATLYIVDSGSNMVRKISGGVITLVAGSATGVAGFSGDGGQAPGALLNHPTGVAVDSCGNVYIADSTNNRIRMVTVNGAITTIAGTGAFAYGGDGGPALSAQLFGPSAVAVDSSFNVYVADTQNQVIRMLTPDSPPPCVTAKPAIRTTQGVLSASDWGAFSTIAPGSWIEIYGTNLAPNKDKRQWTYADFSGLNAPTSLDGTTVAIAGQSAFIDYVSPGQVNAQVPSNIGLGPLPVTVSTAAGTSASYTVNVAPTQPGLYAPASFVVNGKQYVAATFTDGVTFVAPPGAIPGNTSRQAKPGETIIFYGIGFGPVNTGIPAGQIVQQANTLVLPFSIFFGPAQANLLYSGLAGNFIGLYEFYTVVPNIADSDLVPLTFSLNGVNGAQTLYTAVHH